MSNKVRLRQVSNRLELVKPAKRKERPQTPKQEAHGERFKEAAGYASGQIEDPQSRALYAKKIDGKKKRTAFQVALSDYIQKPEVKSIDARTYNGSPGSTVVVKATDDFMVTKVTVAITGADGALIEKGDATLVRVNSTYWSYTATVSNPSVAGTTIQATAFDRPGNATSLTKVL